MTTRPYSQRGRALAVVIGSLLALALGLVLRPTAHSLQEEEHGDTELAASVRELTGGRPSAVAVGVVRDGQIRTASIGAPLHGTYEIGSITKGITGMLYVDAVERGEVEPDTTLGEVFGLGDAAAADVTLEQLSQHASGLPRLAGGLGMMARAAVASVLARDPYSLSTEDNIARLNTVGADGAAPLYSNYGFAVLGHALAAQAGTRYDVLVAERVSGPLGLDSFTIPTSAADLAEHAVQGRDASGRRQQAWTGLGDAPAGAIRADIGDMTELARALLTGTAPGSAALEPAAEFDEHQIGAGWFTSEQEGLTYTWHDGGTGGFRTWLGMDRASGTAVVVLAATSEPMGEVGLQLLTEQVP
ncbi:serine hydrolase domain-containing protein [Ornithinimicrobium pratense]|uniref:Beta-lactamase family protein n=1 Tax=Ornithinimicrobium pratense TaxID=2593973 RepID=A0A5J6V218_9MICO|nr:serine hydrolase domain-containing protein [Ornithinimicrobium pratense]QFG67920.1 beta-lactamase family protein [Ornithinimicrobium pratense]